MRREHLTEDKQNVGIDVGADMKVVQSDGSWGTRLIMQAMEQICPTRRRVDA